MNDEERRSLAEYMKIYSSEEACEQKLYRLKWPHGFVCPKCGHERHFTTTTLRLPLYTCKKCRRQTTATVGTMLEKTRVSLPKWFLMIFLEYCDIGGVSGKQLERDLEVTYLTVRCMKRKLKAEMKSGDSEFLGAIVRMDEEDFD